jgi:octaprenyl-diphosphate synthase
MTDKWLSKMLANRKENENAHSSFLKLKELLERDIAQLNDYIIELTTSHKTEIIPLVSQHIISSGGKRIRPLLTIACACALGYEGRDHTRLAVAVELIHTATLLHDDVIDESKVRRGKPTAHQIWDNKTSILVGDFLFSQAFMQMVKARSLQALDILSTTSAVISESEVWQLQLLHNIVGVSDDDYLQLIYSKTASLLAASCEVGAIIAGGTTTQIEAAREYGLNLGMAFQIVDDILDYIGDADKFGKKIGNDLIEGKVTLPIILAYNKLNPEQRGRMEEIFSGKTEITEAVKQEVITLVTSAEGFEAAYQVAEHYITKAISALQGLAKNRIAEELGNLAKETVERQN